jgi:hypothetical protein
VNDSARAMKARIAEHVLVCPHGCDATPRANAAGLFARLPACRNTSFVRCYGFLAASCWL